MCAVGNAGAVVEPEGIGGVSLGSGIAVPRHDHGKAASREQGPQFEGERHRDVFFQNGVADAGAAVAASMCRVKKYGGAIEWTGGQRWGDGCALWRSRNLRRRSRCLRGAEVCRDGQKAGSSRFFSKIQDYKWLSSVRGQWV